MYLPRISQVRRARRGHLAHLSGADPATSLWGMLGGGALSDSAPPPPSTPSPAGPLAPMPAATPTLAVGAGATPAVGAGATPVVGAGAGMSPSPQLAADAKAREEKLARMKKLLAVADKRLAQAQADLHERDARIQRLEATLRG